MIKRFGMGQITPSRLAADSLEILHSAGLGARNGRRRNVVPTLIEPCDTLADTDGWKLWTNCTVALDADNYRCGKAAFRSVKITPAGGGVSAFPAIIYTVAKNLSNTHLMFRFYIHPGSGDSSCEYLNDIKLRIMSAAGDYDYWTVYGNFNNSGHSGWFEVPLTLSSLTTGAGAFNIAAVDRFQVVLGLTDGAKTPEVTIDEILVTPEPADAHLAFRIDDGLDDIWDMAAYMESKGIVGNVGVVASKVGTANYLTLAQLLALEHKGWLLANHTYNHPATFYDYTDQQKITEYRSNADWMRQNGIGAGARICIAPSGHWKPEDDDNVYSIVADQRHISGNVQWYKRPMGFYDTSRCGAAAWDDKADSDTALTNVKADHAMVVIGMHGTGGSYMSVADFKTFVDSVATDRDAGNIKVVTLAQLMEIE